MSTDMFKDATIFSIFNTSKNTKTMAANPFEKKYINGVFIKSSNYGIKAAFTKAALEEMLALLDEKGYTRVELKERREADKNGNTHYLQVDTWKPTGQANSQPNEDEPSDLPF